ncbi:hypothetical protein PGTUg99_019016 [Puccinia graminis f. sp. tritici]|uniref:DDE Tnp4 domain-containing protein n=1 Tax=Puccinia graminis f. sp. tritici TaxID=56615 RepID=A0A5B0RLF5_PUCGR|nr:hypothetical protein PGTUg99_019016 [Puccinia graminis f. sp. tritici]
MFGEDSNDSSSSDTDSDIVNDDFEDEEMSMLDVEAKIHAVMAIQGRRYLGPRQKIEKAPDMHDFILNRMQDNRFKQFFRMTRASFLKLCAQVEDNPIFHNNSNHPQRPVIEQMMVTLNRLGCYGNGVAIGMLATCYRIGDGTVELYTNRCILAILSLRSQLLTWPEPAAREEIKSEFEEVGFDGCVGLIDGTLVILSTCPEKDGPD